MAFRRPLVLVSGQLQQLASGDNLDITKLYDSNAHLSVDAGARVLYDGGGSVSSVSWGTRFLYDSGGGSAFAWDNRILYNGAGSAVIYFYSIGVGIGGIASHMLDVYGVGWFQAASLYLVNPASSGDADFFISGRSPGASAVQFQDNSVNKWRVGRGAATGNADFQLYDYVASALRFTVKSSTGVIQFNAYTAGTLSTDGSGNVTSSSDERLKDIVDIYRRGLGALRGMQPKLFHWNKRSGLDRRHLHASLTAQILLPNIPEAVFCDTAGFYSVKLEPIVATLVNAVNELDARLLKLENNQP